MTKLDEDNNAIKPGMPEEQHFFGSFGDSEEVAESIRRNEEIAKGLEETGFSLTGPEEDLVSDIGPSKDKSRRIPSSLGDVADILEDDAIFWRELYYQQSVITRQLEQKLKEIHG